VIIYECLYEEGIALYNELSDDDFKKLIRKQYNYIKQIAKEGFYLKNKLHIHQCEAYFLATVDVPPLTNRIETIRMKFVKIAAKIVKGARYLNFKLFSTCAYKEAFGNTLDNINKILISL